MYVCMYVQVQPYFVVHNQRYCKELLLGSGTNFFPKKKSPTDENEINESVLFLI